jgi:hypothetical protein
MRNSKQVAMLLWVGAVSSCPAYCDDDVSTAHIDAAGRAQVVAQLDRAMQSRYVFPDVAVKVANEIATKDAKGGYAAADNPASFAEILGHDLQKFGDDQHLAVRFEPSFSEVGNAGTPTPQEVQAARQEVVRGGFGIARVERLPGNVGYVDLREFDPVEFVAPAYEAALSLLRGTDALILDLRENAGGDPESVAFLLSHFFAEGDDRHLNDIYDRTTNSTRQFWTVESVRERYDRPVYVLTSASTFSAGEECAYDLQVQKRATLIGEITRGGANPGSSVAIGHGLVAFIPFARSTNPVTHANWEHVGVKPDVSVPANEAERTAYATVLKTLIAGNIEPEERKSLQQLLVQTESKTTMPSSVPPPQ